MKDTISDLRVYGREPQIASADRIHSTKCVRLVAGSPVDPAWSGCAATAPVREPAGAGDTIAPVTSLWRLSLAGRATDRVETVAYVFLAVGSAVSLLNGFWRLDYFLANWPSFVELVQRVFS